MRLAIAYPLENESSNLLKLLSRLIAANEQISQSPTKKKTEYCYLRLKLTKEFFNEEAKKRLSKLGLECLEQVKPFEAYGIIKNEARLLIDIQRDPIIFKAEEGEPNCAK